MAKLDDNPVYSRRVFQSQSAMQEEETIVNQYAISNGPKAISKSCVFFF